MVSCCKINFVMVLSNSFISLGHRRFDCKARNLEGNSIKDVNKNDD
jgi:hypothetical protein